MFVYVISAPGRFVEQAHEAQKKAFNCFCRSESLTESAGMA